MSGSGGSDKASKWRECGCLVTSGGGPHLTWDHEITGTLECPDDGVASETHCVHHIDLKGIRQRAEDYIESLGAGNWGRDDDTWIDMLRPAAGTQDALLMGRFVFAISPDAILAILDTLEALHRQLSENSKAS
ncbi:hypothetical protein [Mycobacteroides chelonae]|uniref:hypothetical protein n=1 Tax=Mycobacteroides chelonae TaxID=1774 RepID=UPI0008A99FD8|nr:hypothetical protein [Mycobacteroides chelonae]OHU12848.1 hypothetical protein BKG75_17705 [Mycobacteroides chelonae]